MALVSVSVTDMKKSPDYQSETVSQAMMGTPVEVTGKESYWYSIVTPEGYEGWTTEQNIALFSEDGLEEWKQAERLIVKDYFILVTEAPEEGAAVLSDCVMGNILEKDNAPEQNGFTPVILPDGRKGFVPAGSVTPLKEWMEKAAAPTGDDIVSTAKLFTGFPYLWKSHLFPPVLSGGVFYQTERFSRQRFVFLNDPCHRKITGEIYPVPPCQGDVLRHAHPDLFQKMKSFDL